MASALLSLVDLLRTDTTSCGIVFRLLFLDRGLSRPCEYQHRDIASIRFTVCPIGFHFALHHLLLSGVQVVLCRTSHACRMYELDLCFVLVYDPIQPSALALVLGWGRSPNCAPASRRLSAISSWDATSEALHHVAGDNSLSPTCIPYFPGCICLGNADRVRVLRRGSSAAAMCSERTLIACLLASEATGRVSWNVRAMLTHPLMSAAEYIEMTYDSRTHPRSFKQDIRLDYDVSVLLTDVSCVLWLGSTSTIRPPRPWYVSITVSYYQLKAQFGSSIQFYR